MVQGIDVGAILTYILTTVLAVAIPVLVAYAIKLGKDAVALFQEHVWVRLTTEQQDTVRTVAMVAVNMAEQIAKRDDVQNAAKAKFDMANAYMNGQLAKYGITLTAQEVEAQIEAAVSQQFNIPPSSPKPADVVAQGPLVVLTGNASTADTMTQAVQSAGQAIGIAPGA